jgi:hypothetical protein
MKKYSELTHARRPCPIAIEEVFVGEWGQSAVGPQQFFVLRANPS